MRSKAAKKAGFDVRGPFPADSFFYRAFQGELDAALTLCHDQGRTSIKAPHFGQIIIVMIGIPVLYGTVAHGTALDKAGKGVADPGNFIRALQPVDRFEKPEKPGSAQEAGDGRKPSAGEKGSFLTGGVV